MSKNVGVVHFLRKPSEKSIGRSRWTSDGGIRAALLAADAPQSKRKPFSFNIDNIDFTTREVVCQKCANHCEIVCVYRDDELIDAWGNRCDKGAIRPHNT